MEALGFSNEDLEGDAVHEDCPDVATLGLHSGDLVQEAVQLSQDLFDILIVLCCVCGCNDGGCHACCFYSGFPWFSEDADVGVPEWGVYSDEHGH